ncbi:MAG TPA: A/G-specific adenine glycosylase [Salinimicrobium sp.]|nr:A/G-specific adenine glycosylase [Salinimicrobium sp.]
MDFSKKLIDWYLENKRDLPWRNTTEPYRVWLSEIILQQTRVEQGFAYYLKFLERFPVVEDLANASEEEILKMWQGLGYYSRARNLHATAKYVSENLSGKFPGNHKDLIKLKGIGDYTASAIASSCYKEPVAVVDGNVFRFLSRYFGVYTPTNSSAGIKEFKGLAQQFLDSENPDLYNQGLMEFGSKHCKPQNPLCETCPFSDKCYAFRKDEIKNLPVKIKNLKIKNRYLNYLVPISAEGKTIIRKRKGKGIWQNLYEFPLVETIQSIDNAEFEGLKEVQELTNGNKMILFNENPIQHKLTHQHLFCRFWIVECDAIKEGVNFSDLKNYPVPVLIQNFIDVFQRDQVMIRTKIKNEKEASFEGFFLN